jgi:uncharacterized protein (TIGR02265 family)
METVRFRAEGNVPLEGPFDLNEALDRVYAQARTKGMFLSPLVQKLGPSFREVEARLEAPPRLGRYLPYVDYPVRDHVRLIDAAGRVVFPRLSPREAHRRLGKDGFVRFAESRVGRVVMQLIAHDPKELLLAFPRGYDMTVRSRHSVEATELAGGRVRLRFSEPVGAPEYILGMLEGIVTTFGRTACTDVETDAAGARYDMGWSP